MYKSGSLAYPLVKPCKDAYEGSCSGCYIVHAHVFHAVYDYSSISWLHVSVSIFEFSILYLTNTAWANYYTTSYCYSIFSVTSIL